MATITLKREHEGPLERHHPWVFSGAIGSMDGEPAPGDTVDVQSADGMWLGKGSYSPRSQISVRMWTWTPDEPVDTAFFRKRLESASAWRRKLGWIGGRQACRLVNSESDGLPGITVDRYADVVVCQFNTVGADKWKQDIADILAGMEGVTCVVERSDATNRQLEGLEASSGLMRGKEAPAEVEIEEGPCRFLVDVREGHKTGFYLDQRVNRAKLAGYARDAEVLNCFSYTGAFGIMALKHGAKRVVNVDTSGPALALAAKHAVLNGIDASLMECVEDDVGHYVRRCRDSRQSFDLVILDPPKFAESKGQVHKACRAYKDMNLLAFKLLRPGGCLFTFSCSGHIDADLFQKVVASAAVDARRKVQIVERLEQGPDHPVDLAFPEGWYLKGLVCRVGDQN